MEIEAAMKRIFREIEVVTGRLLANWPQFLAIHLAVNLLIFVLLAPAAMLSLRIAVSLSGDAALSDQDIFFFILSPGGFLSFLVMGAAFSIIVFLEHAALLAAARSAEDGKTASIAEILVFLASRLARLFSLATRVLLRVTLGIIPFALLLVLIYYLLLSEFDINYYLSGRPPEWRMALGLGGLAAAAAGVNLIRQFVGWVFCLPLLLFNDVSPKQAMSKSREAARGHRFSIGCWLLGWLSVSLLLAAVVSGLMALAGHYFLTATVNSVTALVVAMGIVSFTGFVLSFAITFISSSWLSLLILELFRGRGMSEASRRQVMGGSRTRYEFLYNRNFLAWGLLAGLLAAVLLVNGLMGRVQLDKRTEIMAHRGASNVAPENTIAAVHAAIESGAHWVEIDVQETADGAIVVIHDSDLKKIGGVALVVAGSTLQELQQVDIGSWFGPEFADQRVPELSQVLELCKGRIGVNIELKYYGREKQLEKRVAEIVDAAGMADQVIAMSLNIRGIREMRRLRPDWTLGLLSSVAMGNLAELDVDFLALNGRAASRHMIRQAHDRGKKIMVWTVNDAVGMVTMISRGADVIITDEPALGISVLEQHGQLETAERLLIQLADIFDQPSLYQEQ
jgi:glycerophosphoryl diester phosphodiesterase